MDGSGERSVSGSAFFYDDERALKGGMAGPIGGPFRVSHNWRPGILLLPRAGSPLGQICCRAATITLPPLKGRHGFRGESRGSPATAGSPLAEFSCRFATSSRRLIFFLGWLGRAIDDGVQ
jgi:hypothetical protein